MAMSTRSAAFPGSHCGRPSRMSPAWFWRAAVLPARLVLGRFVSISVVLISAGSLAGCSLGAEDGVKEPLQVFGSRGRGPGHFVKPRAIAANQWGEIFVVDRSGRIQKFDSEGRHLLTWNLEKVDNGYPTGLDCDSAGDLWVADTHNSRILHYSRAGQLLSRFGEYGEEPGRLVYPTDVLVSPEGFVFVTEYGGQGRDRVMKFRSDGSFVAEWGGTGTGPGQLRRAMGLCFDPEGNIWVADSCNHRLQCLTQQGEFVRSVGGGGGDAPVFLYPYDVAVDSEGNLVVCERGNHRVQRVTRDGRSLSIWGAPGSMPGKFHDPWGIGILGNHLFVVDALNDRVQVFTT